MLLGAFLSPYQEKAIGDEPMNMFQEPKRPIQPDQARTPDEIVKLATDALSGVEFPPGKENRYENFRVGGVPVTLAEGKYGFTLTKMGHVGRGVVEQISWHWSKDGEFRVSSATERHPTLGSTPGTAPSQIEGELLLVSLGPENRVPKTREAEKAIETPKEIELELRKMEGVLVSGSYFDISTYRAWRPEGMHETKVFFEFGLTSGVDLEAELKIYRQFAPEKAEAIERLSEDYDLKVVLASEEGVLITRIHTESGYIPEGAKITTKPIEKEFGGTGKYLYVFVGTRKDNLGPLSDTNLTPDVK